MLNLKVIFLAECNKDLCITLQETNKKSGSHIQYLKLPGYTLVYEDARMKSFHGVTIYVHDFFSFRMLDNDTFKHNSTAHSNFGENLRENCNRRH